MTSANLRLRLFGSPVVTAADGAPLGGGNLEPQRLALLALLALHPKRTVSRAELTKYLWSTRSVEQARNALNQAVFGISKALGDDAIFSSAKEVRLGTQVSVDALEFQSALDAGRPEEAMRLYTAPLMEGFELDDTPEFQQWAASQRARFATAARTQRPVAEAGPVEDLHDLSEPVAAKPPEPPPPVTPTPPPEKKVRKTAPAVDFALLEEPDLQAPVEQAPEGPELRAQVPLEPELLTNAVPSEPEPVPDAAPAEPELMTNSMFSEPEPAANSARPGSEDPAIVPPPPSPPQEEVRWIVPDEPTPAAPDTTGIPVPAPVPRASRADVPIASRASAPIESKPVEKPAKPRRPFPRPSARLVVTVLVLVAIGALAYVARGWSGAARGGIEAAREGVAAVRERADAARQAREKQRSIAVLPIEYSGRNKADSALVRRIVEELGPMLTRAGLIVKPAAAFTRSGPPYDLRVIADSLGVAHVLQGAMQREGAGVAFRFRLVNPVDGSTRWEDTYRPKLADIPVLQEDVAATVGAQILRASGERD